MGTSINIALTMFTVLAPAGAVAFTLLSLFIVFHKRHDERIKRLEHWMIVPLAVCMIGLVASATHLGTPANALFVVMGWGRSPLSNEVVSAVGFLFVAGMLWLASFSSRVPNVLMRLWLLAAAATGMWLVAMIGIVYAIPTIPTWNSVWVPLSLWTLAFTSGPLLAIATLRLTFGGKYRSEQDKRVPLGLSFMRLLTCLSILALIATIVIQAMQGALLSSIRDSFGTAADQVPWYLCFVVAYGVLGAAGISMVAVSLLQARAPKSSWALGASVLVLLACTSIRVGFYALHMTIAL